MEPFIASIIMFAGNFAPRGWAFCDGQLLPISQNTALFSLVGTIYGGDGRTTFALPDLRGRVPMHPGNGPGLSDRRLGQRGGAETATLSVNQIPSHSHVVPIPVSDEDGNTNEGSGNVFANTVNNDYTTGAPTAGQAINGGTTANTGGGQAHNIIQPYTCINYIIALQGIFPSRS